VVIFLPAMSRNTIQLQQLDGDGHRVEAKENNTSPTRKPKDATTVQEVEAAEGDAPEAQDAPTPQEVDVQSVNDQSNPFSEERLHVAMPVLSLVLFVSVFELGSVASAIPAISSELHTGLETP
jgi:hypothetical protein